MNPYLQELAREWTWLFIVGFCAFLYLLYAGDDDDWNQAT